MPMTENINFVMKFSAAPHVLPISADERIKDVVHYKDNILHIHCKTTDADPYAFTIALNNGSSLFSVVPFLASLVGSSYEPLIKEVEAEIDRKSWVTKEGLPLRAQAVASKLRSLTMSIATMAASQRAVVSILMPLDLSRVWSNTNASQGSTRAQSQGGAPQLTQPSPGQRNQKRNNSAIDSTPADSNVQRPTTQTQPKASTASALTEVLVELEDGNEVDLEAIRKTYERFWMECQGCFIFDIDEKREVRIDQLDFAPLDWTIRAYKERRMEQMCHYFLNMPDRSAKQTICVMPQSAERPTTWDEIKEGRF